MKVTQNFIKEIIDYSRNNRTEVEPDEINFETLINDILEKFEPYKNFDKVKKNVLVSQTCSFATDQNRLEIIFNNLISNAIKFSNLHQSPPSLDITIEVNTDMATICFKDNGVGIHPNHLPKIFEMFYRATDQNVGSGLGLFLVKETVEKLEGSIEVHSTYGEGSIFTVAIPNLNNVGANN
ncbi:MAG: HAMP domain-containing sensor histidine kinase [Candidatus Caenarcaniphilales bacterium]|nr:HAMP domain-containing sensor histidine kinase [Candidatus Caenarcaniphilales bacterium]